MEQEAAKRRRNWWIPAFVVALVAFEFTRELFVLVSAEGPVLNGRATVHGNGEYASVRGRWERTDGGSPLSPSLVAIECQQETGRCFEASVNVFNDSVFPPEVEWFAAQFSPEAVTYENASPVCVTYAVRIDLRMQRVLGLRERKSNVDNPNCRELEPRIEMQIGDPYRPREFNDGGHFVPLVSLLVAVLD